MGWRKLERNLLWGGIHHFKIQVTGKAMLFHFIGLAAMVIEVASQFTDNRKQERGMPVPYRRIRLPEIFHPIGPA